jgi:hypothetical protein
MYYPAYIVNRYVSIFTYFIMCINCIGYVVSDAYWCEDTDCELGAMVRSRFLILS